MNYSFKSEWLLAAEKQEQELKEDILTGVKKGINFAADEELIQRIIELKPNSVLDFGCGLLRNFLRLREVIPEVWGYDSAVMLSRTNEPNTTDNWDFLRHNRFDVTLACLVFQHISPTHLIEYLQWIALNTRYLVVAGRNCYDDMKTIYWPFIDIHFKIIEEHGKNWDSLEPLIYNCRIYESRYVPANNSP